MIDKSLNKSRNEAFNSIIIYMLYICAIFLFLICNSSILTKSSATICNLILICFVQLIIFISFKIDIISGVSFLTVFTLWPSILIYYFHTSQDLGDISSGIVPIYMYEDSFYVLLFILIFSLSAYIFHLNIFREKIMHSPLLKLNDLSICMNNIIAICASFIAFPEAPQLGRSISESSFNGLLPGHAWNQLAIVALLFNFGYLFKKKSVLYTYLFTIFWFVSHGERADLAGFFLFMIIFVCSSNKIKRHVKVLALIFGIVIIIFFISVKSGYSIFNSFSRLFTFTTVSDTSYELNDGMNYIYSMGYTHGRIFVNTIKSIIPLSNTPYGVGFFLIHLNKLYPGGSSIINAPLMDWGTIGVGLIPIIYAIMLKLITKVKFSFARYEIFILICLIPRISWYGIDNVFTSVIFFVPFIYFMDKILSSEIRFTDYGSDK